DGIRDFHVTGVQTCALPICFTERSRGKQRARRALDAVRRDQRRAEGASTQPLLASGQFVQLQDHPRADCNQLWLLAEVRHQGYQPQVLEAFAEVDRKSTRLNSSHVKISYAVFCLKTKKKSMYN